MFRSLGRSLFVGVCSPLDTREEPPSIRFHEALQKAGVASELNLLDKGGHGYGLGVNGGEVATWPARFEKWLEARGLLKP